MATDNSIHLIRHGHFVGDPRTYDHELTPLGRRQARRTATRFRGTRIARVYSSDMPRASATAEIVIRSRRGISVTALPLLREMLHTRVKGVHVPLDLRRQNQRRIDQIVARFLTKRPRNGDVLIFCHGNLIRAVVCRILGTPVTKWLQLGTYHCAITSFGFKKDGRLELRCFNDTGHLPEELRTIV